MFCDHPGSLLETYKFFLYHKKHKLLAKCQSGFRKGYSTATSVVRLTDYCFSQVHNGKFVGMVALDLKKAFDTVDHKILLNKLKYYGVVANAYSWFKSYLTDRQQVSIINGVQSDIQYVNTGVPQGSILGPMLFIIYINDLEVCMRYCEVNMYADDTTFYIADRDSNVVKNHLQEDLLHVHDWLCANKLTLHIDKTNCMLIGSKPRLKHANDITLDFEGNSVKQVECITYLGIQLDSCLKFDTHVHNMICKLNRAIGVLKRASKYLPLKSRILVYNTIVLPHFDYCVIVWGTCNEGLLNRLQKIQNKAMRTVLQCPYRTHICDMLTRLNWMNVRQRIFYQQCMVMWRVCQGTVPDYLINSFSVQKGYNTRAVASGNYKVPRDHQRSFAVTGSVAWNTLPSDIKLQTNQCAFKKLLVRYIFAAR